jgi:hypothetical protein
MAGVWDMKNPFSAPQPDNGFSRQDRENAPANLRFNIDPDESAFVMPIDVGIIDVACAEDEMVVAGHGSLREAIFEPQNMVWFNRYIDIRRSVLVDIRIVSQHTVGHGLLVKNPEESSQEFLAWTHARSIRRR